MQFCKCWSERTRQRWGGCALDVFMWVEVWHSDMHYSVLTDYDSIKALFCWKSALASDEKCLQPAIKNHQSPADNTAFMQSIGIHYFHVSFYRSPFNLITFNNRILAARFRWMNMKLCEIYENCIRMNWNQKTAWSSTSVARPNEARTQQNGNIDLLAILHSFHFYANTEQHRHNRMWIVMRFPC